MTQVLGLTSQQAGLDAVRSHGALNPGDASFSRIACFQKRAPDALVPFYPLSERLRDTRPNVKVDGCPLVGSFLESVTQFAFDDVALIELIHQIVALPARPIPLPVFNHASYFLEGKEPPSFDRNSTELTMASYEGFLQFLEAFQSTMGHYASVLGGHGLFSDLDVVIGQASVIRDIVEKSTFNVISSGLTVYLPEEFKPHFDDLESHAYASNTTNPFKAKHLFLNHLGLYRHVEYFLALAVFIEGAIRSGQEDTVHCGVLPDFEASDSGLCFEFEGFSHAQKGTNERILFTDAFRFEIGGKYLWKILCDQGLLVKFGKDSYGWEDPYSHKWRGGLSKSELVVALDAMGLDGRITGEILASHEKFAFQPFGHIRMDAENRIKILTGANSRGKTTLMKTLADQLHMAMMGRCVPSKKARLSACDRIFHDFDVKEDLSKGVSKFRAQMRNVKTFLEKATPNSLGLFDELYHGTNSAYLLALAWATIEAFSRRNLRVIIATHEPLLTRVASSEGYASIRGLYHRPSGESFGRSEVAGVGNIRLGEGYELAEGAVTDSDAFRIAEEEGFPPEILERAREVILHITSIS